MLDLLRTTLVCFVAASGFCCNVVRGQEVFNLAASGDTGIPGADPSVIRTQDGYVAVESRRGQALLVRVAPSLEDLAEARAVRIWYDRDRLGEIWAPEIVFRNGRYSVYFTAGVGSDHRMYEISSAEPDAGYGDASEILLPEDKWAIDGLPFTFEGRDYFVWSGWQGDTDVRQDIFIVRLNGDGVPEGSRSLIASPDQPWENVAGETPSINEGPQPIVDPEGQLHIVYSANGSWNSNYCLADLRLAADGDPMDAGAWAKSQGCQFGANPRRWRREQHWRRAQRASVTTASFSATEIPKPAKRPAQPRRFYIMAFQPIWSHPTSGQRECGSLEPTNGSRAPRMFGANNEIEGGASSSPNDPVGIWFFSQILPDGPWLVPMPSRMDGGTIGPNHVQRQLRGSGLRWPNGRDGVGTTEKSQ
ncbi:glycoside hydrolase family 43 protein [Devosia riboflavina]